MNNCILMAEIIQEPQLRHTPDGLELAEMMVQFPGLRPDDPPAVLRVVGWGNLAKEIYQNNHQGDHVLLEGRLNLNTIERPEGFKEKRAELTLQRIHSLGANTTSASSSLPVAPSPQSAPATPSVPSVPAYESPFPTPTPVTSGVSAVGQKKPEPPIPQSTNYEPTPYPVTKKEEPNLEDDIPF